MPRTKGHIHTLKKNMIFRLTPNHANRLKLDYYTEFMKLSTVQFKSGLVAVTCWDMKKEQVHIFGCNPDYKNQTEIEVVCEGKINATKI